MNGREFFRRRLIKSYSRTIRQCEQLVRDIQYWNSINPRHQPFDCEDSLVLAALCREALGYVKRNENVPDDFHARIVDVCRR